MHVSVLPATRHDLGECIRLLAPYRDFYGEAGWACLAEFLSFLLQHQAIDFCLVRNARIAEAPIVGFDSFVFVTDDFVRELATGPPYVARTLLDRFREDRLPILTPRAAYRAHHGSGLNILHLFAWFDLHSVVKADTHLLMDAGVQAYYARLSGLRCQCIVAEAYGPAATQWCKSAGFSLANDYADYFRRQTDQTPPRELQPSLMIVTASEAASSFGSRVAPVFRYLPPQFHFARSEQALLRQALAGDTDEELAESLGISVWTIKKRWRQIYDRVSTAMPELLNGRSTIVGVETRRRGLEQRRHLLAYLRNHPEELCAVESWRSLGPDGETLCRESTSASILAG
jgi:DNA-binding CsgD family transcriptional regulator